VRKKFGQRNFSSQETGASSWLLMCHLSFSCGNPARPRPGENTVLHMIFFTISFSFPPTLKTYRYIYIYNSPSSKLISINTHCVVLENIHIPLTQGCWKFQGRGGGNQRLKFLRVGVGKSSLFSREWQKVPIKRSNTCINCFSNQ